MGLLHTSSIELSRYRALLHKCPEIHSLNQKSVAYLGFDGTELGLSNRFLRSPKVLIQSKYKAAFESQRNAFQGKRNLTLKAVDMFDERLFGGEKYDCIIWWKGLKDDEGFKQIQEMKKHANELIVFGFTKGALSEEVVSQLTVTEFRGLCLAFIRVNEPDVKLATKPESVKPKTAKTKTAKPKTAKPVKKPAQPKKKAERKKPVAKSLSGKDVTVGEMKTEQESMIPTNIKSSSAKVQPMATEKPKKAPKSKSSTKANKEDAEAIIEGASEQTKMELAFMISGELPESLAAAELVIRSATKKELELVF